MTVTSKKKSRQEIWIPINPVPASRPRVSKWGTYYGATYDRWRKDAHRALAFLELEPVSGKLSVHCEFIVQRPKTTKREYPRGDLDNFEKAALDILTQVEAWGDDDQIIHLSSHKRFTLPDEEPGTKVTIEEVTE
jgi:Holliday junction resolvase RusA-like endonuclease